MREGSRGAPGASGSKGRALVWKASRRKRHVAAVQGSDAIPEPRMQCAFPQLVAIPASYKGLFLPSL